jgi:hypothetical protein
VTRLTLQALDDLSKKFAREDIIPFAKDYDKSGDFPWPIIKKAQYVRGIALMLTMQRSWAHEHAHPGKVWRSWPWIGRCVHCWYSSKCARL